jgi:hypothetical protein
MKILIVSICVNYLDYLSFCFEKNKEILLNNYYFIITTEKDTSTQEFCRQNDISYYITNEFYNNHNPFNKARALNFFFKNLPIKEDSYEYILLLDSDCIISNITDPRSTSIIDTFNQLSDKSNECLYGCGRRIYNTFDDYKNKKYIQEGCHIIGYFQLFHKSNLKNFSESRNASVYDCMFADTFKQKKCLPCDVDHIGPIYMNWDGRHPESQIWR